MFLFVDCMCYSINFAQTYIVINLCKNIQIFKICENANKIYISSIHIIFSLNYITSFAQVSI